MNRPLLPNWASIAITSLAAVAVISLVWHLYEQNRVLREAQAAGNRNPVAERTPVVGDRLPAIGLVDLDGATQTVPGLVADGAVVAFLTTTCPFCEASLPQWEEMATKLGDAGIPFLTISLDDLEETRAYAAERGITWPLWTVADSSDTRQLRINSVPVTAIVSSNAEITQIWRGQLRGADVENISRAARKGRLAEMPGSR